MEAIVKKEPLLLKTFRDGKKTKLFSEEFLFEQNKVLVDMSLNLSIKYFSSSYVNELEKSCKTVLGICELGLLSSVIEHESVPEYLILEKGVIHLFQVGWGKISKVFPFTKKSERALLNDFSLKINESKDLYKDYNKLYDEYKKEIEDRKLSGYLKGFFGNYKDFDNVFLSRSFIRTCILRVIFNLIYSNGIEIKGNESLLISEYVRDNIFSLDSIINLESLVSFRTNIESNYLESFDRNVLDVIKILREYYKESKKYKNPEQSKASIAYIIMTSYDFECNQSDSEDIVKMLPKDDFKYMTK